MQTKTLACVLARTIGARLRCIARGNTQWRDRHEERILALVSEHFPRGGGLDHGPRLSLERSTESRLVIERCDFHHMNPDGFYDGWTEHEISVKGSLAFGFDISVTGRDRNEIKNYLHEIFSEVLAREVPEHAPVTGTIPA